MSQSLVQFVETWQKSIAQVMTQIAAKPVAVSWEIAAADAIPSIGDDDLWVRFSATSFSEGAELAFHVRSADALTLSQIFMGDKIDSSATLSDDSREAVAEASRQIAGRAATELKQSFPGCELTYLQEPIPSWKPEAAATFKLTSEGWSFTADVFLNTALAQSLAQEKEKPEVAEAQSATKAPREEPVEHKEGSPAPPSPPAVPPPLAVEPAPAPLPPIRPQSPARRVKRNNLELLLDVNLAVTLRFGQRQMTLRDILQLRSGSVIELDRQTDEPVDLLLDDRIVARGEVVVVDGNYGLRVSEICAQSERIGLLSS
jgi:flagellar motor switch protein FliN